jgi:hypothetical protein
MGPRVLYNTGTVRDVRALYGIRHYTGTVLYGINVKRPAVRYNNSALLGSFFIGLGCAACRIFPWAYKALCIITAHGTASTAHSAMVSYMFWAWEFSGIWVFTGNEGFRRTDHRRLQTIRHAQEPPSPPNDMAFCVSCVGGGGLVQSFFFGQHRYEL